MDRFFHKIPKNKKVIAFTCNMDNEQHWAYLYDLSLRVLGDGGTFNIVDLQNFLNPRYYGLTLGPVTYARKTIQLQQASDRFKEIGVEVIRQPFRPAKRINHAKKQAKTVIKSGIDLSTIFYKEEFLSQPFLRSSLSKIISMIDFTEEVERKKFIRYLKDLSVEYDDIWETVAEIISSEKPDFCIIHNGRVSHEAAMLEAVRASQSRLLIIEHGGERGKRYRLAEWEIHDRVAFQDALSPLMISVSEEEVTQEHAKLISKTQHTCQDRFTKHFQPGLPIAVKKALLRSGKPLVVLYTNSPDELVGINPKHYPIRPMSQMQEMTKVVERLEALGFHVVIRIHPNISNKAWKEIKRVKGFCRNVNADIISPMSSVSSYELAAIATINVVWRSTIGIELTALGYPVLNIAPARYDQLISVGNFWQMKDSEIKNVAITVESEKSIRYLAALKKFGGPIKHKMPCFFLAKESRRKNAFSLVTRGLMAPFFMQKRPMIIYNFLLKLVKKNTARLLYNKLIWGKVAKRNFLNL